MEKIISGGITFEEACRLTTGNPFIDKLELACGLPAWFISTYWAVVVILFLILLARKVGKHWIIILAVIGVGGWWLIQVIVKSLLSRVGL